MALNNFTILGFVCLLIGCHAQTLKNTELLGVPYEQARSIIISSGWSPLEAPRSDLDKQYNVPNFYYKAGYAEVFACSGTGEGYCLFKFKHQDGRYLTVTIRGGDYDVDQVGSVWVYDIACSDKL